MIVSSDKLAEICEQMRRENKKIVFTNGCFDIVHAGHVTYLYEAKSFGDILIIGINTDDSVRRLKGEARPLVNQKDRAVVLSALEMVDFVTLFDEDTPLKLIKKLKPDVLVKGGDYTQDTIVGADFVIEHGGEVRVVPLLAGRSTTSIIERIKAVSY